MPIANTTFILVAYNNDLFANLADLGLISSGTKDLYEVNRGINNVIN